ELSSPNARCFSGGEYDVSSYLPPYRKCPFLMGTGIGKSPDSFFLMAVRACVLPRVNEKFLMVTLAANVEIVGRFVAW
ncbi:TPA: hypothetical protein ACP2S0_003573, partial [Escherichia coli]